MRVKFSCLVKEIFRFIAPHPVFEYLQMFRLGGKFGEGHLV